MRRHVRGFTLVEAVMVIAITGILSAIVAVFIQKPIQGYFDATRRAELTDIADTAVRRLTRDLRLALPNSIRVDASGRYLEFLITTGGGRYRAEVTSAGAGDILDFTTAAGDASFDVIGTMPTVTAGQHIVVFNLGTNFTGGDAWQSTGSNRATVASASGNTITLSAAKLFPYESPGKRFHVVDHAVTYECDPATGVLRRYWNYGINAAQVAPPSGGSNALLATRVAACTFSYEPNELLARYGTVAVRLALSADGETVNLHAQAHVSNVP
jgi:MSHA biogenesis protein MshO